MRLRFIFAVAVCANAPLAADPKEPCDQMLYRNDAMRRVAPFPALDDEELEILAEEIDVEVRYAVFPHPPELPVLAVALVEEVHEQSETHIHWI